MRSYAEFAAYIAGARDKQSRKLCNNTYAEKRDSGSIAVRLHRTDVLTFTRRGTVTFNTGGWNTVTTKARINEYAPSVFRVYSDHGILYLCGPRHFNRDKAQHWGFFDGITVNLRNKKPRKEDIRRAAKQERENKERQRMLARQNAQRRRKEKRDARIVAGIDALFAHFRAPYREGIDAAEAICKASEALHKSMATARVVDVEPPADAIDAWHIIGENKQMLYGNCGPVEAGQTWHVPAAVKMCAVGLHASRKPSEAKQWARYYGKFICRVKVWGDVVEQDTKMVGAYRKVVWVAPMPSLPATHSTYRDAEYFDAAVYALEPAAKVTA
jgi:hypothetical protein